MGYRRLKLNGKVAVVIGGSSGIGRTIARGLAEAGADVVPTARRLEQVQAVAAEIEALGRRSLRVTSDVTDRSSLERLLHAVVEAFGKVAESRRIASLLSLSRLSRGPVRQCGSEKLKTSLPAATVTY
jgi:NAD(P)-dependent dehydrogenase (short-subunit alcohol dehydrogenase family)